MKPIAIFYHGVYFLGDPPQLSANAFAIVQWQMKQAMDSGLVAAASHFVCGINGGEESEGYVSMSVPHEAQVVYHGLESKSENLTIVEIEKWVPSHPDWYVLYFHAKGCTHPINDAHRGNWRNCMMHHLISNWRRCVQDLDFGFDSVGCHWFTKMADGSQNYWAGTFFWAKSSFLATLPSIYERQRIKDDGIGALTSRFESEVWIGNGPRLPKVMDYHPRWKQDSNH